jgi:hypothetical protein
VFTEGSTFPKITVAEEARSLEPYKKLLFPPGPVVETIFRWLDKLEISSGEKMIHKVEIPKIMRREFISSTPLLLFGAASLEASVIPEQAQPKGADLTENLSPAELAMVNESIMASDMDNYWHKGYSCAETGLMVALRYLKKPENLVWVAGGFGGGIGHQDLCGFLTAGIMGIGLHTGALKLDAKEAKMRCGQKTNEYWNWWISTAPLHCRDIRENRNGFEVCHRLGKLASVKLESLLKG